MITIVVYKILSSTRILSVPIFDPVNNAILNLAEVETCPFYQRSRRELP